jgi:hypothetical protein
VVGGRVGNRESSAAAVWLFSSYLSSPVHAVHALFASLDGGDGSVAFPLPQACSKKKCRLPFLFSFARSPTPALSEVLNYEAPAFVFCAPSFVFCVHHL